MTSHHWLFLHVKSICQKALESVSNAAQHCTARREEYIDSRILEGITLPGEICQCVPTDSVWLSNIFMKLMKVPTAAEEKIFNQADAEPRTPILKI